MDNLLFTYQDRQLNKIAASRGHCRGVNPRPGLAGQRPGLAWRRTVDDPAAAGDLVKERSRRR
jgi:hypothetical protein